MIQIKGLNHPKKLINKKSTWYIWEKVPQLGTSSKKYHAADVGQVSEGDPDTLYFISYTSKFLMRVRQAATGGANLRIHATDNSLQIKRLYWN